MIMTHPLWAAACCSSVLCWACLLRIVLRHEHAVPPPAECAVLDLGHALARVPEEPDLALDVTQYVTWGSARQESVRLCQK